MPQRGGDIALIAALFGLLKEEGFKRDDDPDSNGAFGRATVYPTICLLA
jgi:hypothetical protein